MRRVHRPVDVGGRRVRVVFEVEHTARVTATCCSPHRPTVAASFYPLAFVAERVGGSDVRVQNLTPTGVESHDLELTARQVGEIAAADLIVYEKGLPASVDEAVDQNASGVQVEVTDVVSLDQDGDPHVWLDPTRLAAITPSRIHSPKWPPSTPTPSNNAPTPS